MFTPLWLALAVALAVTSARAEQAFHVSASAGNDANPGTAEQPFQSIQRCVDVLAVQTYEDMGDLCFGDNFMGSMDSEDLELCADLCRQQGTCEFFVVRSNADGSTFFCQEAVNCGGGGTSTPKYRAMNVSEWAPEPRSCIVGEGVYHESVAIHHVKGSEVSPVSIRAAPNSNVSLDGTIDVAGWAFHMNLTLPDGGQAVIWESETLDENVWQLWIQPLGQTKATPQAQKRMEMMIPARWPNARFSDRTVFYREFWGVQRHAFDHGCSYDCSEHGCKAEDGYGSAAACTTPEALHGLLVDDGTGWRNLSNATWNGQPLNATGAIAVMNSGSWQTFQQVVDSHLPGSDRFNYTADFRIIKYETNGYFLEGKKEFLDGPEEWWIDTATRKVYMITDDGMSPTSSDREVRGKTIDYCITITQASHLTIEGFHMFGCGIRSDPTVPYTVSHLTVSSNEFYFSGVTKRALGHPMLDMSPSMMWLYTSGRSDDEDQLPLVIFNNTWFGSEGTVLNYRGQVTVDNNLFFNNDWTGVEGRDGNIGMAVIVGQGKTNTTIFTNNSLIYNGPSVTFSVDSAGSLVRGNIVAGQCFGMIQNDGSHIQTMTSRQNHTIIEHNWAFDSPKASFRFDDSAQCYSNSPTCIGHFGTMNNNVDLGTRGLMVKGNNHVVLNNLAIGAELRVYDMFKNNDCPLRCMNNFTTVQANLGTALQIQRSVELLADPDSDYNLNVNEGALSSMMPGYLLHDFRPLAGSAIVGYGPYGARNPSAAGPSQYWIPGRMEYRASYPIPAHNTTVDYTVTDVIFRPALGAVRHHVYVGCHEFAVALAGNTNSSCAQLENLVTTLEAPLNVQPLRASLVGACPVFYWRVDAEFADGIIARGEPWRFGQRPADAAFRTQQLDPVDEGIASLVWGMDITRPVGGDGYFTADEVMLGGRPTNAEAEFDYFVKFDIQGLHGARLRNARVTMTKLAATLSDELRDEYDAGDEDDHLSAWVVPPSASTWSQATLNRRYVEDFVDDVQLSLGTQYDIGQVGSASFDATSSFTDDIGRVIDGSYSFRFATGSRRRAGSPTHTNSVYTTMGNRLTRPQLELELDLPEVLALAAIVTPASEATNSSRQAVVTWSGDSYLGVPEMIFDSTAQLVPLESARIASRQGGSALGPGDADRPVGLRSCAYDVIQSTPYEWFVKFNVSALRGQQLKSVTLSVSKCKSSQACVTNCKAAGTCTCMGSSDGQRTCGGSNIDLPYDPNHDDLHIWNVANNWDSDYTYPEYSNSFGITWSNCDQQTLLSGDGSLAFANYLGVATSVGENGTVNFDVKNLVAASADTGDGILSFRFTVNGTAQRFYIAEGAEGGPALTVVTQTVVREDTRWYELQRQEWDAQGVEPLGAFSTLHDGPGLNTTVTVATLGSALVRVRAMTQAELPGAAEVKGEWNYLTLFRADSGEQDICGTQQGQGVGHDAVQQSDVGAEGTTTTGTMANSQGMCVTIPRWKADLIRAKSCH